MIKGDLDKLRMEVKKHRKYIDQLHRRISKIKQSSTFSIDDDLVKLTIYILMVIGVCVSLGLNFAVIWKTYI
jgi:hypothetical protein